ncbi:hypothetical protein Acr_22g0006950 [Actinidia rufa]|uniref:Uncharacterized protein n=1 Tax=Actinidia rufa TaxID=165716 RepID=A0A7J0GKF6_9ERIC|nr:hypothetical protein Acr_22g0006950 [Actinidia rufa]
MGQMNRGYRATIPAALMELENRPKVMVSIASSVESRITSLRTIDRQRGNAKRHFSLKNQGPSSEEGIAVLDQPTNEEIEGCFEE